MPSSNRSCPEGKVPDPLSSQDNRGARDGRNISRRAFNLPGRKFRIHRVGQLHGDVLDEQTTSVTGATRDASPASSGRDWSRQRHRWSPLLLTIQAPPQVSPTKARVRNSAFELA